MRPFDEKWKDHRLHDKVDSYHSTIEFLYKSVEDNTNDNDLSDSDDDLSTLLIEGVTHVPAHSGTRLVMNFKANI